MTLIDELIQNNTISPKLGKEILEKTAEDPEVSVDDLLIAGGVDAADIATIRSRIFNIPVYTITDLKSFSFELLKHIPLESVERYRFAPLTIVDGILEVGIVDPDFISARDAISFIANRLGYPYKLGVISKKDFDAILHEYKSLSGQVTQVVGAFTEAKKEEDASGKKSAMGGQDETQDLNKIVSSINATADGSLVEDAPIIKLVAAILKSAIEGRASDIHIEPVEGKLIIRFRKDGVLKINLELPPETQSPIIARVKILSNLKLDEKRKPQDGRFSSTLDGRKVDFRVSTLPCYFGEKAVIRILDSSQGIRPLDKIGLSPKNYELVKKALDRPYGIILVSGPTGSGKTTTLYSMLGTIDKETENVVSLEDPVEYNMSGVNQSQIMPEIGYTFAAGLRSILRQDPDVILVGEIRDKETAQLAIQAALTGHLVLSTIHTNTAIGVIPRLLDMGVDPYLIAPTLICAIGQRLTPSIDPECLEEVPMEGAVQMALDKQFGDMPPEERAKLNLNRSVHESKSTEKNPTGLKGRVSVHEVLWVDKDIETAILRTPTEPDIYKVARAKGFITLKEDALFKSMEGKVPLHEVYNL
jgi:type IV pilus assembly protein PilB